MTVLDVSYFRQLALVQYPTSQGYRQAYVDSNYDIAAAIISVVMANGATVIFASAVSAVITQVVFPEAPVAGAVVGGLFGGACSAILTQVMSEEELEKMLTDFLSALLDEIFG